MFDKEKFFGNYKMFFEFYNYEISSTVKEEFDFSKDKIIFNENPTKSKYHDVFYQYIKGKIIHKNFNITEIEQIIEKCLKHCYDESKSITNEVEETELNNIFTLSWRQKNYLQDGHIDCIEPRHIKFVDKF